MAITLPIDTPTTNVLRFLLIEYIIVKLFAYVIESFGCHFATKRASSAIAVTFQESWLVFFLVPYRIRESRLLLRVLPWVLVVCFNAFLLSIEFGFDSNSEPLLTGSRTSQIVSTPELTKSKRLPNVKDIAWVTRTRRLALDCVTPINENEFYVADGFVKNVVLQDDIKNISSSEVICGGDSRLKTESRMDQVMFNVSYSNMEIGNRPFRYVNAELKVVATEESLFDFGGDIDIDVKGELDLSYNERAGRENMFNVSGSCTGFLGTESGTTVDDPELYCLLSDGDKNRFIFTGMFSSGSDATELAKVSSGQVLRLEDGGSVFRAELLFWDESWRAKDGDHLAAIKLLAAVFRPRRSLTNDATVLAQIIPEIVRCFCINVMFGATSLEEREIEIPGVFVKNRERAEVKGWALVLLCAAVGGLGLTTVVFWWAERKAEGKERWNVPVTFNALGRLVMEEDGYKADGGVEKLLVCGLRERDGAPRYGPVREGDVVVGGRATGGINYAGGEMVVNSYDGETTDGSDPV